MFSQSIARRTTTRRQQPSTFYCSCAYRLNLYITYRDRRAGAAPIENIRDDSKRRHRGLCKTYMTASICPEPISQTLSSYSRRFSGRVVRVGNDFAAAPAQSPNKNRMYSPVLVKKSFCCSSPLGSAVFSLENSQSFDAHRSSITAYSDDLHVIHVAARSATRSRKRRVD